MVNKLAKNSGYINIKIKNYKTGKEHNYNAFKMKNCVYNKALIIFDEEDYVIGYFPFNLEIDIEVLFLQ